MQHMDERLRRPVKDWRVYREIEQSTKISKKTSNNAKTKRIGGLIF